MQQAYVVILSVSRLVSTSWNLVHSAKWQRVEQCFDPVACRVVDVRVLTQELTQCRRVGGVVVIEVGGTVQRHQHDQTLLAFQHNVVMIRNVELFHAVVAVTDTPVSTM